MDWTAWKTALELFMKTPELIVAAFIVVCSVFAFAWWLCSRMSKERIEALQERLQLQVDNYNIVTERLKTEVAELKLQIERNATIPVLAANTATISGTIGDLSLANSELSRISGRK